MKKLLISIFIAFCLWFVMFSPWTKNYIHFWMVMSVSGAVLTFLSIVFYGSELKRHFRWSIKDLILGVVSAAVLWGVFWLGNFFSTLLFPFAEGQIDTIYGMKTGFNYWIVGILLVCLIGPAEEIFWRGYVQQRLSEKYSGIVSILIATVVYAFVHISSLNFMLIMAALVCGLFWALLYRYNQNLLTVMVSHALWDVAVFILFPIV